MCMNRDARGQPGAAAATPGPGSAGRAGRDAFTLIELLVSMAILLVMITFLSRLLNQTTGSLELSNRQLVAASTGRAIMELITRDLAQAFTGSNVSFVVLDNAPDGAARCGTNAYGVVSDELYFVTAAAPGSTYNLRTSVQTAYYVGPAIQRQKDVVITNQFSLVRAQVVGMHGVIGEESAYHDPAWHRQMPDMIKTNDLVVEHTVADHVVSFNVLATLPPGGTPAPGYDSSAHQNRLPLWLDVSLEVLAPADARQVALLWPGQRERAKDLLNLKTRRYTARVHFPGSQRDGWHP